VPATTANLAEFEAKRAEYEAKAKAQLDGAEARKAALDGVEVTLTANASTEGKLYGSISPRDIAEALTKHGHKVEKSEVVLGEGPLRRTGEHEVVVHLHADIDATVKVIVVGEVA
jgi:large subunit ribosomal protein L9